MGRRYSSTNSSFRRKTDVNGKLYAKTALRKTPPPQQSLHRRLGGLKTRYGPFGDERNLMSESGIILELLVSSL